jgi:glycine oxidase
MRSEQTFDMIIVGGGIAGCILAMQMHFQQKKVLLIDLPDLSSSSKVAAGIWNPVVFKRLSKSYLADELVPYLHSFYAACEQICPQSFVKLLPITKFLKEEQELLLWQNKKEKDLVEYLQDPVKGKSYQENFTHDYLAYAQLKHTGMIDTRIFLSSVQSFLKAQHSHLDETFDFNLLLLKSGEVHYKNYSTPYLVFCEGHLISQNPFFNYIPMKPVKGEVITIEAKQLHIKDIVNKGIFIQPLGNDRYKVGATYNWEDLSDIPSDIGVQYLENQLKKIVDIEYSILSKEAGIRPSVIDRRPLIGQHPKHSTLGLFNGFGTKAVMLAPYLSEIFYKFIYTNGQLPKEIDCQRFNHLMKPTDI